MNRLMIMTAIVAMVPTTCCGGYRIEVEEKVTSQ